MRLIRWLSMALVLGVASSALAVSPLFPKGSYAEVCTALQPLADEADQMMQMAEGPAGTTVLSFDYIRRIENHLMGLAYSRQTRLTVNGDHIDPVFDQLDVLVFNGAQVLQLKDVIGFRASQEAFGKRYRCKIIG